jgi:hypothetical protein
MNEEDRSNLRDLHAGFALVGLLMKIKGIQLSRGGTAMSQLAESAYEIADAMQEARDQHSVGIVSIKRQTNKEKANET